MAEPDLVRSSRVPVTGLRAAATAGDVRSAARRLGVAPAALAPALVEPGLRLLLDDEAAAALLRRQWSADGAAEAVLAGRARAGIDVPEVLTAAAGWGCDRVRDERSGEVVPVPLPGPDLPLPDRFRRLAALAATRVEAAVALARGSGAARAKADGSPALAADEAAHTAAAEVLRPLGVPVLSEERRDAPVDDDAPWVVLDPLDGTGNFAAGLPPWAFSAALVSGGRPVAGLVADLSSGRRWEGAAGAGAWRDGVPVAPRTGGTVLVPSAPAGALVTVPPVARRIRISGCTALDLCLVADGAAAAWHDVDRSGTHVHDVAGGLAVLLAAGGAALTPDGRPLVLRPDTVTKIRFVAAPDEAAARDLLAALG